MSVKPRSLKSLVLRGSAWTIAGNGAGQLVRLARSLILTRLLFPEAFGQMSLVWAVMFGLAMLSDVGLASAIVRDKRGDDADFLNTAWTVQAIRGAMLWVVSCLVAAPMATFYGEPDLAYLIPVAGLTTLISGFNSTALHTCRRRMEFGRLTVLELSAEVVGLIAVLLWALLDATVWALVGGALIGSIYLALASHVFLPGIRNTFCWEVPSLRTLVAFGKWIFLSSAFHLFATQGDRIFLGHYLSMAQLGVYSIAITLCEAVEGVVLRVNAGVLLPAYSRTIQTEPWRLHSVVHRARLGVDVFLILPIAVLMVIGTHVVDLLYDDRYQEAGWMLQILCIRLWMKASLSNSEACLVALGHPKYAFLQSALRALWILAGIPIGWKLGGIEGAIWALALSELPVLAVLWAGLIRHQLFSLLRELRSIVFVGLGAFLGFAILHQLS